MAGAGYKNFAPGEVLTSSDVDNYLMEQSVMVFAGTAARGTTLTSPAEGMFSYRTDADALEVYNGTAWVPAAQAAGAATVTNRNLLYNSAMQISQRGTSTTGITGNGYNTADRWNLTFVTGLGTWTQDIQNDAPTGSGFRRSLRMLCTTAQASPASTALVYLDTRLEGQDVQRIRKGTSSAQKLTLSFWVKSNVTGTYIARLGDQDNNRAVSASYTISASATWERKTVTFPADTTGAFDNDNAESLRLQFWLASGSNYTGGTLQTTWVSATDSGTATGQTNLAAATNNYWQVTGVQLEVGDVATDFEFKSYGQELVECERYFKVFDSNSTTDRAAFNGVCYLTNSVIGAVTFSRMRAAPAATVLSPGSVDVVVGNNVVQANLTLGFGNLTPTSSQISVDSTGTPFTLGHGAVVRLDGASVLLSAEL